MQEGKKHENDQTSLQWRKSLLTSFWQPVNTNPQETDLLEFRSAVTIDNNLPREEEERGEAEIVFKIQENELKYN